MAFLEKFFPCIDRIFGTFFGQIQNLTVDFGLTGIPFCQKSRYFGTLLSFLAPQKVFLKRSFETHDAFYRDTMCRPLCGIECSTVNFVKSCLCGSEIF